MPTASRLRHFVCFALLICAGCDDWSDAAGVRPRDAVLNEASLRGIGAGGGGSEMTSLTSVQGCEAARSGLDQLAESTGGAMQYGGKAELIVERAVWAQVPAGLQGDLATAIAVASACETEANPRDVVVTIREPDGGPVLRRGKPASFAQ